MNQHGDNVVLAQISRAFPNLRVGPANAGKFGIKWQEKYFLDSAVAFGWVHEMSAFQMLRDTITHIIAKRQHKIFAYIDDYFIVSSPEKANLAFHERLHIFMEHGLPINETKLIPPSRVCTCLGISVNDDCNTLSINPNKLQEIYMACQKFDNKKYTSKKHLQPNFRKLIYIHK